MTPAQLAKVGAALCGPDYWQSPLSRDLGVSSRTLRRWVVGDFPIPPGVWGDCCELLRTRRRSIVALLREIKKPLIPDHH